MSQTTIVRNIGQLLTMDADTKALRTRDPQGILGLVEGAAMVIEDGKVEWAGPEKDLPNRSEADFIDAQGRVVMPGLVECHTHLLFGGNRAAEFELRSRGASYEEVAEAGGGIANTVKATREIGADSLFVRGLEGLDRFLELGVTTLETKSGYGLDLETELKLLQVARSLHGRHCIDVVGTFLGAHIVPPEYKEDRTQYVDLVCNEMIPQVASEGLAEFCDVFCEEGAFIVDEARRILTTGLDHGLRPKVHAEQLTHSGASQLAAELGSASADHLDFATREDAEALARGGTAAVLLPGATFFIGKHRYPDGAMLVDAGATVALSTDFNPGSSHTRNLWLMGTFGCTYCGLTPSQALYAITAGAAKALGRENSIGRLTPGHAADFIFLEDRDWQEILYLFGRNPVTSVYKRGALVRTR